jgi:hypothetical protein
MLFIDILIILGNFFLVYFLTRIKNKYIKYTLFIIYFILLFMYLNYLNNENYLNINAENEENVSNKIKGICYFDIDGTLTTSNSNKDLMVQECLDNNFDVGIVTASNRKLSDICSGDKANVPWMSDILCKKFNETEGKLYNSRDIIGGKDIFPPNYPHNKDPGYIKGFDMVNGRDKFYPDISDKCLVLFDDDPYFIQGVKNYNKNLETQCANNSCGLNGVLNLDIVKNKIQQMKNNGCK